MKLTNENGVPEQIFQALLNTKYSGEGEERYASVTELIAPAFQTHLKREHAEEISQEASEFGWALIGNAFHHYMESMLEGESEVLTEERLAIEIDGKRITGGVDFYDAKTRHLIDYKTTSAWTAVYDDGEKRGEWEAQVNVYAYMYRKAGFPVDKVSVILILRDWSKMKHRADPGKYPASMFLQWDLRLWKDSLVEDYLRLRIGRHEEARAGKILDCKPSEKWEKPTVYAVKKAGRKSSVRNLESLAAAEAMCTDKGPGHTVEIRPGDRVRCSGYCPVNKWCDSYQQYKAEQGAGDGK